MSNPSVDDRQERPPAVLQDRYQLLECIGEGGMGVVWRCFDLDLEEPVAIKFLRPEVARDEALRAAFRREVKLSRRVTHPNVARVFEFGRDGDTCFLTMEYVAGESLQTLLGRGGRVAPGRLPALAVSLCRGLAAAHVVGVVHGDIKPGNILIDPGRGAVLTDFGIARAVSDAPGRDDDSSGTPIYMPPERLRGGAATLACDVYAVGVVLFEALTGRVPWPDADGMAVLRFKCSGHEPDLPRIAPDLPPGWTALIADCLRADPARRPADARALLARLAGLHAPDAAAAPARVPQPPLAVGGGSTWVHVAPFTGEDADHGLAWMTGDLVQALTQHGLRVVTDAEAAAGMTSSALPHIRGEVRPTHSGVRVSVQISDAAAPIADIEVLQSGRTLHALGEDLAARIVAAVDPDRVTEPATPLTELDAGAAALYVQARDAEWSMRPAAALRLYDAALARAPDHPALQLRRTHARIQTVFLMREPDPAEVAETRALAEAAVAAHGARGDAHLAMAGVMLCVNDPIGCARALRNALRCAPGLAVAHGLVADLLLELGRLPDAERRLDIAAALATHGVYALLHRARLLAYQSRWDEYYALLTGKLADRGALGLAAVRYALWQPARAPLERLAEALAAAPDGLSAAQRQDASAIVAFALWPAERQEILAQMLARANDGRSRHARMLAQVRCDMACVIGDLAVAREQLRRAEALALIDRHWLVHAPTLAVLRDDPTFHAALTRVHARADEVAEALWDWTTPP